MGNDNERRLGIDTGGTFTDVIKLGDDGTLQSHKLLSTPDDPSAAIGEGVEVIVDDDEVAREIIHGTTVATNALLERQGADIAFVTTAGFEDLLWMRRQHRPDLYALNVEVEAPLVDESHCFGVDARMDADGSIIDPLSDDEVVRLVEEVARADADAVVICLLHAYANRAHEQRLAEAFRQAPNRWHITASCEVTETFREYERSSTAAINGYVGPVMQAYLHRLQQRVDDVERLEVLQSHGGRASADHAARLPVHTVLSGPAGGVIGAIKAARELGVENIISFDMGGTSTDVSLASKTPTLTEEGAIGGHPLQIPIIDIHTVGAGGGSIAAIDPGGALTVGPQSAGADPGPAAYGRGGEEATVTDAHVVLGSLRPNQFLGGGMGLDVDAANRAVDMVAGQLGTGRAATARGILDVADAAMARAIKVISLERGHDPREYTLVSFGGAGGLHACRVAESLEMSRVLVPRHPGLLSAVGMLRADARRLYSKTVLRPLDRCLRGADQSWLNGVLGDLERRAKDRMGSEGLQCHWTASLRYEGQSFSIAVDVDWSGDNEQWSDPTEAFEQEHHRLYGYRAEGREVELVDLRLEARRSTPDLSSPKSGELHRGDPAGPDGATVTADLGDGAGDVRVVERSRLLEGQQLVGPAIITEYSGTTLVLDGWAAEVRSGHLFVERR